MQASRIHTFMAALLIVKVLSLFFEAGMYYHIARVGHTEGWTIMYDIVGFVKGACRGRASGGETTWF